MLIRNESDCVFMALKIAVDIHTSIYIDEAEEASLFSGAN